MKKLALVLVLLTACATDVPPTDATVFNMVNEDSDLNYFLLKLQDGRTIECVGYRPGTSQAGILDCNWDVNKRG